MEVVLIFNGLGNQMSQYAFYLAKKKIEPKTIVIFTNYSHNFHKGFELSKAFGINLNVNLEYKIIHLLYKLHHKRKLLILLKLIGFNVVNEPIEYKYSPNLLNKGEKFINIYWGGWHCEKYFENIKSTIISSYEFKIISDKDSKQYKEKILSYDNSVRIHVRRGDYLNVENNNLNNVCDVNYYRKAISYFNRKFKECKFFLFSDDINWCKEHLIDQNIIFIENTDKTNSWIDMYLMTLCKHHINANSTYSWWAAWLSPYKDSIIIRPHWFINGTKTDDFYPKNWLDINKIINE